MNLRPSSWMLLSLLSALLVLACSGRSPVDRGLLRRRPVHDHEQ